MLSENEQKEDIKAFIRIQISNQVVSLGISKEQQKKALEQQKANPQQVSGKTLTHYLNKNSYTQQSVKQEIMTTENNKKTQSSMGQRSTLIKEKGHQQGNQSRRGNKTKSKWPKKCLLQGAIDKSGTISFKFLEAFLGQLKPRYQPYRKGMESVQVKTIKSISEFLKI
ncbi:hypothetical protein ABPG72_013580 [Tetrahymena utriculariae]